MSASLVGSEMCIRDSAAWRRARARCQPAGGAADAGDSLPGGLLSSGHRPCLLYTSDAADDM
eukprot:7759297-Alexandrium_andersonii.AAC.1